MSWERVTFESLYEVPSKNGVNKPSRVRGEGVKMVNMGELFQYGRIGDIPMERVPMADRELASSSLEEGDLLFARQSLVLEGAGKCSIVRTVSEPTTFEGHLIRVRLDKRKADPQFYYYYFGSSLSPVRTIVQQCAQAGIKASELAKLGVHCPPPPTQQRIAAILSAHDDLIENNRRRIQLLEQAARLIFQEWFVRLRFPGHEHARVVAGVPEGWERRELRALCDEIRDTVRANRLDPTAPYIGLEHMPRRSITLSSWGVASEVQSDKHAFRAGDILFGKIRPYFHKVGVCLIQGVASTDAIVIRPRADSYFSLVLMTVSSDLFVAHATQSSHGSKMPRANWKVLERLLVFVPPDLLLREFNNLIAPIVSQLRTLALTNRKLHQARDLLLPKLMSGEIEV